MKVRDLLTDESKWCKGELFRQYDGACCLEGLILKAYGSHGCLNVANRVRSYLQCSIIGWNDDPATTFGDVKRLVEELDI